jgi:hypothetical protein
VPSGFRTRSVRSTDRLRGVERDDQDDRGDFAIDGKVARAWRIGITVETSNLTNFAMVFEGASHERLEMRIKRRLMNQLRRF